MKNTDTAALPTKAAPVVKTPRKSSLEVKFDQFWTLHRTGLPHYVTQHRFHPVRLWRFDVAWPELKVAVELHGGTWSRKRSGHTTGKGIDNDLWKASHALILGWSLLTFTTTMLANDPTLVFDQIKTILDSRAKIVEVESV